MPWVRRTDRKGAGIAKASVSVGKETGASTSLTNGSGIVTSKLINNKRRAESGKISWSTFHETESL